jgi:hypothetical protein
MTLADPSRGNIRMPAYSFLDTWLGENDTGIIFVIEPKDGLPGHDTVRHDRSCRTCIECVDVRFWL